MTERPTVSPATDKHVDDVLSWLVARGHAPYPRELLSGLGFVVDGIAACWIYETGTPLVVLEHLVANPEVDLDQRDEAIDAVVAAALAEAHRRGGRFVYATTKLPAVVERARRHGFNVAREGATMIVADLDALNGGSGNE